MLKKILVILLAASLLTACSSTAPVTEPAAETETSAAETEAEETEEETDADVTEEEMLGDPEEGGEGSTVLLAGAAASMGGAMKKYHKAFGNHDPERVKEYIEAVVAAYEYCNKHGLWKTDL